MPQLVTIPVSTFEMTIEYETPSVRLWADRTRLIQGLFDAFSPWSLDIDDIEVIDDGKNSEKGLTYRLPSKKVSFFFGASYCKFTQDDANWKMAAETSTVLTAGLSTLLSTTDVKIGKQKAGIALHLKPKAGRFTDILHPLVPQQLSALEETPFQTMASVVQWNHRKVYIDGSGSIANALFVRLDRDFGPSASFQEIADQIYADESLIFKTLGLEEDRS